MNRKNFKKAILLLVIVSVLIIGIIYKGHQSQNIDSALSPSSKEGPEVVISKNQVIQETEKKSGERPTGSIHALASKFSRSELELLKETSRLEIDHKLVNKFIEKSKETKNHKELLELAGEIGKDDLALKLELIKYANSKYPPDKPKVIKSNKNKIKTEDLFKKIKQSNS